MIHVVLVCAGLLAGQTVDSQSKPAGLKTYEALRLKAGRDPGAQVKLALWCEAHGLGSEQMKHLAMAVLVDPKNSAARGLLGLLDSHGHWETLDRARERLSADSARLAHVPEYERRRANLTEDEIRSQSARDRLEQNGQYEAANSARMKDNRRLAQAHVNLGLWCERSGLKPEATAHFTVAIHFDPYRESTWKRLGYAKRDGQWTSPQQSANRDRDERQQARADHQWEPLLKKWKAWLVEKTKAAEAEGLLVTVADRRAIPSILKVFPADGRESTQLRRVRLLGQIDDPLSSRSVAAQAILTRFASVRYEAINILKGRPARDYAANLVEMIHGAVRYEVQPVSGSNSRGALVIDAPRFRMIRTYDTPPAFELASSFRGYVGYDANGLPIVVSGRELDWLRKYSGSPEVVAANVHDLEIRTAGLLAMAAETSRRQMAADIEVIEATNQQARTDNASVIPILESAAGAPASLGDDEEAWQRWWYDRLGYSYQSASKPMFTQDVMPQYQAPYIRTCFAAGTPVETLSGARPIEAIEAGDRVLTQDAATGALSIEPVVYVHRNPPGKTLRIGLSDGNAVVCSIYHRFWRANAGWAQARELKTGETLRHFGGTVRVESISTDADQRLYNLDVATTGTFFAGQSKLLVHDNTLPDHRLVPFDALPMPQLIGPAAGE